MILWQRNSGNAVVTAPDVLPFGPFPVGSIFRGFDWGCTPYLASASAQVGLALAFFSTPPAGGVAGTPAAFRQGQSLLGGPSVSVSAFAAIERQLPFSFWFDSGGGGATGLCYGFHEHHRLEFVLDRPGYICAAVYASAGITCYSDIGLDIVGPEGRPFTF